MFPNEIKVTTPIGEKIVSLPHEASRTKFKAAGIALAADRDIFPSYEALAALGGRERDALLGRLDELVCS